MADNEDHEPLLWACLGIGIIAAVHAVASAIIEATQTVFGMFFNLVTSWWIIPIGITLLILTSTLINAHEKEQQHRAKEQAKEKEKRKREQKLQRQLQAAQRKEDYLQAYKSFQFVLERSPSEARVQLEQMSHQYSDLLRTDIRLTEDYQKLLSTESGKMEYELRERLGL